MKEKANDIMKGLPEGWKWVRLLDISENIQYGYTESSSKEAVGPKFLRITDIQDNRVLWDEVPYCRIDDSSKKKYLLQDGDLVFARTGATVGKSFLLKGKMPESVFASYLIRVRVNKEINEKYLSNFFHSTIYWSQITEGKVGTGQPNVNGTKLGQLNVPLPPLPTQQAIVSKIEELFSELDKGIEQLKTAQQQLKTYRQSVLKWAFEGRLTNEKVKDGELQAGWKMMKLKEISKDISDGDHQAPPKSASGVPFITISNINKDNNRIDFTDTFSVSENYYANLKTSRKPLKGDVLYTVTGSFGIPILIDFEREFCFQRHIGLVRPSDMTNQKWLYYLLQSPTIFNQAKATATGTAQKTVALNSLRNFVVPYCSIEEQKLIVQEIESRLSVADKMEESITQSLQQAEVLRQSILKKAFEGKLVSTDTIEAVQQTAKVVPFERKVLAGKIIHLLCDDKHFGLTKFQKILYLVEHFAQVPYETNFIQERAGPYDKAFTTAFRKEMQEKDWVQEEQRTSITKFIPGQNIGSLISGYAEHFRPKSKEIVFVIQQLKDKSTHEAELIATLYAVWNNRLIGKKPVKINLLVEDFFNWSAKKKEEFQEEEVIETYKWMKEVRLVPKGFGKVIES